MKFNTDSYLYDHLFSIFALGLKLFCLSYGETTKVKSLAV